MDNCPPYLNLGLDFALEYWHGLEHPANYNLDEMQRAYQYIQEQINDNINRLIR